MDITPNYLVCFSPDDHGAWALMLTATANPFRPILDRLARKARASFMLFTPFAGLFPGPVPVC
jgi:hypothetical protein